MLLDTDFLLCLPLRIRLTECLLKFSVLCLCIRSRNNCMSNYCYYYNIINKLLRSKCIVIFQYTHLNSEMQIT